MDRIQFSQYQSLSVSATDVLVTTGAAESLTASLTLSGSPTASFNVFLTPSSSVPQNTTSLTWVTNNTSVSAVIKSSTLGGSSVTVAAAATKLLFVNGANVTEISTGGGGGSFNPTITSPVTGQTLTYNGTAWVNSNPLPIKDTSSSATVTIGSAYGANGWTIDPLTKAGTNSGFIYIDTADPTTDQGAVLATVIFATPIPQAGLSRGPVVVTSPIFEDGASAAHYIPCICNPKSSGGNWTGFDIQIQGGTAVPTGNNLSINYLVMFR